METARSGSSTKQNPLEGKKRGGLAFLFVGAFLRFVLFIWGFDEVLSTRKEIVTPVTNFHRGTSL
jgi:hypothetical protein